MAKFGNYLKGAGRNIARALNFFRRRKKLGFLAASGLAGLLATGGEYTIGCTSKTIARFSGEPAHAGQYWDALTDYESFKTKLSGGKILDKDDSPLPLHWAPDVEVLKKWPITLSNEIRIEYSDGQLLAEKYATREYVPFNKIPKHVVGAFVRREDRNFWNNYGINWKGVAKAVLSAGDIGGSGITEQLAKIVYMKKGQ